MTQLPTGTPPEQSLTETPATEQSLPPTEAETQLESQRTAFELYVDNTPDVNVPENFENARAWFDSLQNATSSMTKAQQEAADLKRENEELKAAKETKEPEVDENAELFIEPKAEEKEEEADAAAGKAGATEEDLERWKMELATTNDISPETREDVRKKLGAITDSVLDAFIEGEKSRRRDAYRKADQLLGGDGLLAKVFEWAGSKDPAEQAEINASLSSPAWKTTVLGLAAEYKAANKGTQESKSAEPAPTKEGIPVTSIPSTVTPYTRRSEYYAEKDKVDRGGYGIKAQEYVRARLAATPNFAALPK